MRLFPIHTYYICSCDKIAFFEYILDWMRGCDSLISNVRQRLLIWTKMTPLDRFHAEISKFLKFWPEKVYVSCNLSSKFQNLTLENSKSIRTNKYLWHFEFIFLFGQKRSKQNIFSLCELKRVVDMNKEKEKLSTRSLVYKHTLHCSISDHYTYIAK